MVEFLTPVSFSDVGSPDVRILGDKLRSGQGVLVTSVAGQPPVGDLVQPGRMNPAVLER